MTNRKNRFNLFKTDKLKLKLGNSGEKEGDKSDSQTKNEKGDSSFLASFDSIIPESSPLRNNSDSNSNSGFYNDEFTSKSQSNMRDDLEGVDEKYANLLVEEMDKTLNHSANIDLMLSNVYQKMILKFGETSVIDISGKKPKILFFIGPTGVGKTTTIAKIASKFKVEEGNPFSFC